MLCWQGAGRQCYVSAAPRSTNATDGMGETSLINYKVHRKKTVESKILILEIIENKGVERFYIFFYFTRKPTKKRQNTYIGKCVNEGSI